MLAIQLRAAEITLELLHPARCVTRDVDAYSARFRDVSRESRYPYGHRVASRAHRRRTLERFIDVGRMVRDEMLVELLSALYKAATVYAQQNVPYATTGPYTWTVNLDAPSAQSGEVAA